MLAIQTSPVPFEAALRAPEERLGQYALLRRLPAGLRAEVWLGLPPGGASLGQLVAIKAFFPHAGSSAAAALSAELALAPRLAHPNIVQTLRIGRDGQRPFIVSEHLEGVTLRALLRRAKVAGASLSPMAVARVLLAIVRAVCHAQRQATSSAERALVAQPVATDDVFITFDGAVKLLGFKSQLAGAERSLELDVPSLDASAPAAIDALFSDHLTPGLGAVLEAACDSGASGLSGLVRIEREVERWQTEIVRSDGRAELAVSMDALFPALRLEQRAQLEILLEQWMSSRAIGSFAADHDAPPASGFRTIAS